MTTKHLKFPRLAAFGWLICLFPVTGEAWHTSAHLCNAQIQSESAGRYSIANNGTVTDTKTGLMWMRCNFGQVWSETSKVCLGYAEELNWKDSLNLVVLYNKQQAKLGRYDDWRMPNIKELASIIDLQCVSNAIDEKTFIDTRDNYWTSTPFLKEVRTTWNKDVNGNLVSYTDEPQAWNINFREGREFSDGITNKRFSRLVRNAK